MEIIYFRNFDPNCFYSEADLNFHSGYHINATIKSKDVLKNRVQVSLDFNILQKFDYSVQGLISSRVIVGENGVGKTSVLNDVIKAMSKQHSDKYSLLITSRFVYCGTQISLGDDDIEVLRNHFNAIEILQSTNSSSFLSIFQRLENQNGKVVFIDNIFGSFKLNTFYGDPVSTSRTLEIGKSFVDLSLINRIVVSKSFSRENTKDSAFTEDAITFFERQQCAQFLASIESYEWFKTLIPIHILERMNIRISMTGLGEKLRGFFLESSDHSTLNSDLIGQLLEENILPELILYREVFLNSIMAKARNIQKSDEDLLVLLREEFISVLSNFNDTLSSADFEMILKVYYDEKEVIAISEILNFINDFGFDFQSIDSDNYITLSLMANSNEIIKLNKELSNLFRLEGIYQNHVEILKIEISNISSGERNFIFTLGTMIDRLSYLENLKVRNVEIAEEQQNIVLIFDEPANDFHPEWQRRFMSNLYSVVQNYCKTFPKTTFQILTTTHSPFFLSDFVSSDVIKLRRIETDSKKLKTIIDESKSSTFGANIYDLFHDSFFMKDGFIGEFAKEKIDKVFEDLNAKIKKSKPIKAERQKEIHHIIGMIGEPLIRMQLAKLYFRAFQDKSLEEQAIQDEIDRLEELKKNL